MKALHRSFTAGIPLFLALILPLRPGAVAWAQSNPVPLINQPLVPDAVVPGSGQFTLTVNGTGFVSGATVNWNGTALATTFASGSQLTAIVPSADVASAATASVTVLNPAPGGGSSNAAFFTVGTPTQEVSFGRSDVAVGSFPFSTAVGDFNGDGRLDLVVANQVDSTLSVLLGNGNGSFQSKVDYPLGGKPVQVLVGDFNGDGKPDLAALYGSGGSGSVAVLLGNGDGTFLPYQQSLVLAGFVTSASLGDFNGDGKLDLAMLVGPTEPGVEATIVLGNGDGTFQTPTNFYPAGSGGFAQLVAGDFNGDGKLDVAAAQFNDSAVAILLGNGDGTLQPAVEYATASGPEGIVTADFSGDGKLDLAVANLIGVGGSGSAISVLLGNGDGTFQAHVDYSTLANSSVILTADLNGDGRLDLATASNTSNLVQTFLGNGDGTFQAPGQFATGRGPTAIVAGDFNNDGRLGLVTANSADNSVSLLPQVTAVLSQTVVNFGPVKVGGSKSRRITLTNIGGALLTVSRVVLAGSLASLFSEATSCKSVAPGTSCSIVVTFKPNSPGPVAAELRITDTAASQPQIIYLAGLGGQ